MLFRTLLFYSRGKIVDKEKVKEKRRRKKAIIILCGREGQSTRTLVGLVFQSEKVSSSPNEAVFQPLRNLSSFFFL